MSWVKSLQDLAPDYAKDLRLNLEAVLTKSSLTEDLVIGCVIASAYVVGDSRVTALLTSDNTHQKAHVAAILMAQNNVWYPYAEMAELEDKNPRLRMNAITQYGGPDFEAYSLAASIIGKCHFCVRAHVDALRKHGWATEQIRDVGRIAAVITSLAKSI